MDRSLRPFLNASLLGSMALATSGAFAYPTPVDFDGSLLRWPVNRDSPKVTYEIKADNPQDESVWGDAVDTAASMWSDVPGSYYAYEKSDGTQPAQVTVHMTSALSGVEDSAGYTEFDKYAGSKPLHCSIYVLIDDSVGYTAMAKTFLHEFGHGLGLGHSLIPQAIMSYSLEKNTFALDIDDEAAVARLYPADGSTPKLPPGCAAGSALTHGSTWPLALLLLLAPAIVVIRTSMRRYSGL